MKNSYLNKLNEIELLDYKNIYNKMLNIKEIKENLDFINFDWVYHFNDGFENLKKSIRELSDTDTVLDTDVPTYQKVIFIFQFLGYVYKYKLNLN